jgi:hypothetical protein
MRDFDDNEFPLPLAYLITFRCYGTWLHGDARGSVDPTHNVYGALKIAANQALENANRKQLTMLLLSWILDNAKSWSER